MQHYSCYLSAGVVLTAAGKPLTPSVTLDLSVKRESRAFIGSILEAAVSIKGDFSALELKDEKSERQKERQITLQTNGEQYHRRVQHHWFLNAAGAQTRLCQQYSWIGTRPLLPEWV